MSGYWSGMKTGASRWHFWALFLFMVFVLNVIPNTAGAFIVNFITAMGIWFLYIFSFWGRRIRDVVRESENVFK